jgi:hypothetical protein
VLNIDKVGVRVRCPTGESVIVPTRVKELYTESLENRKLLTIIETVITDSRDPLLLFIITLGKKIIDN